MRQCECAATATPGDGTTTAQFLHRDHLDSVRAITDGTGAVVERAVYKPFGEQTEWLTASQPAPESKGWIGERFDADAGLQYLNARYYDPVLGMFLQPDWFDVMQAGVGTNRFSYSFNDPINKADPNGNSWKDLFKDFFGAFAGSSSRKTSTSQASETASSLGRYTSQTILTSPLRAGEAVVGAYDYMQQNTVSGNLILPDRAAAMSGDPLALAGMVPMGKWAGVAAKGGGLAETTAQLQQMAKNAAEQVGPGKGAVHWTKVHSVWGKMAEDSGAIAK